MTDAATATADPQEEVREQALDLVDEARAITIETDEDYEAAGRFLTERVKAMRKEIDSVFDPIKSKAHAAWREVCDQKKRVEAPVIAAEKAVKGAIATYSRQKEQERRALEEKRRKDARERAEQEALERAAQLEDEGRTEEAEALIERPLESAPAPVQQEAPKAEGVSVRKVTKFRITDASQIKRKFLVPDEKRIRQVVQAMGPDAEELVGGIEVYTEEVVAARAS